MLRLRTFGSLALERDGVPIVSPATQRKRLALLALLCAEAPRGVTRDKLLGFFWGESDEDHARNALYQAISALRREVGAEALIGSGAGDVRVDAARLECDVFDFRRAIAADDLETAVRAYAGTFLDGVYLKDASEFERWLDDARGQFTREYRGALETLARRADDRSDHATAVRWWQALATADPLSATAATGLMNALAAAGDSAAALRHARLHAERLRSELDVEVEPEVERAVERIRAAAAEAVRRSSPRTGISADPAAGLVEAAVPPADARSDEPVEGSMPPAPVRSSRIWWRRAAGILAAGLVIVVLTFATRHGGSGTILVVPFENDIADTALADLGPVTAQWIESGISRAALGTVVDAGTLPDSASDSGPHPHGVGAGGPRDDEATIDELQRIARQSSATLLVWGRITRRGDSLRFEPRFLRPDGRTVLRVLDAVSTPVDQPFQGVDQVRQLVMGALAAESDPRLAAAGTEAAGTPPYDAYVQYVRGLQIADLGSTESGIAHFDTALALDPEFAEASLPLASLLSLDGHQRRADSVVAALTARRPTLSPYGSAILDLERAIQVNDAEAAYRAAKEMARFAPNSPPALWWLGVTAARSNRFYEAVAVFARIAQRPWRAGWYANVYWQTLAYHMIGDFQDELAVARRAEPEYPGSLDNCTVELRAGVLAPVNELDARLDHCLGMTTTPSLRAWVYSRFARELRAHRRFDLARVYGDSAAAISRRIRSPDIRTAIYWLELGRALLASGRWAEAMTALERAAKPGGPPGNAAALLGIAAARAGDLQLADSLRRAFEADTDGVGRSQALLHRARITASMGHREEAVELLRAAMNPGGDAAERLHPMSGLDPLYGYPPFEELLQPVDRPSMLDRLKTWLGL